MSGRREQLNVMISCFPRSQDGPRNESIDLPVVQLTFELTIDAHPGLPGI